MADLHQTAGLLAGLLTLAAYGPYILSVFRKQTIPARSSWFIWTTVSSIIAVSYYRVGAEYAFIMPIGYAAGAAAVSLLSIGRGHGGWSPLDRWCLFGAAASLIVWALTENPLTALIINIAVNLAGTIPTMVKVYRLPGTENRLAWALFLTGAAVNLLAVPKWTWALAVYPVYMFLIIGSVVVLVLRSEPAKGA